MTVPSAITDIFTVAGSNPPGGGENPSEGDNHLRAGYSFIAQLRDILNGTSTTTAVVKSLIVSLNASIVGNLAVAGTMTAGATSLSSLAVTGNETVGGTLGVTGASTLTTLATSGAATLNSAAVTGNATVGGTLGITGIATFTAVPAGKVTSSNYTPTSTAQTNVSSTAGTSSPWGRVGDAISVGFGATVTPTSAAACTIRISLPVASNLTGGRLHGSGTAQHGTTYVACQVVADTINKTALVTWTAPNTTAGTVDGTFDYEVN